MKTKATSDTGWSVRRGRRHASARRGAVLFEFAVTIPLTMLLSIAVFDFARVSYFRLVVADAAGAASRYAAFNPLTNVSQAVWQQGLEDATRNAVLGSVWVDPNLLVIHSALVEQVTPVEKRITVKVEYPFQVTLWWPGIPQNPTVVSQVSVIGAT